MIIHSSIHDTLIIISIPRENFHFKVKKSPQLLTYTTNPFTTSNTILCSGKLEHDYTYVVKKKRAIFEKF